MAACVQGDAPSADSVPLSQSDAGDSNGVSPPAARNDRGGGAVPVTTAPTNASVSPNIQLDTVHLVGRFQKDDSGHVFGWPGTQIETQFQGSSISVTLDELTPQRYWANGFAGNWYDVTLDGNLLAPLIAKNGGGTYVLASQLSDAPHTLRLRKRTEGEVGTARFRGFSVPNGTLQARSYETTRRMLIIGDSISAGYGALGTSGGCHFSPDTENASVSYGLVAADLLKAEAHVIAWSGEGVYRNNDGSTTNTISDLIVRTDPNDPNSRYDWSTFVPDVLVINLGTNDFSATYGVPDRAQFLSAYRNLLSFLRAKYPSAYVLCLLGPMLTDDYPAGKQYRTLARSYIQAAVTEAADTKVSYYELTEQTTAQKGCDSHPNAGLHLLLGNGLQKEISRLLKWN